LPSSGLQGTTFQEPGYNFTPNGNVTMYFQYPAGGHVTAPKKADGNGSYSHSWTTSHHSPPGTYTYWAVDDTTGYTSNKVSFTVQFACLSPHYKLVGGKCLPSCGQLAYTNKVGTAYECCATGCKAGTSMGPSYDCTGCCHEPVGTNSCN